MVEACNVWQTGIGSWATSVFRKKTKLKNRFQKFKSDRLKHLKRKFVFKTNNNFFPFFVLKKNKKNYLKTKNKNNCFSFRNKKFNSFSALKQK